MKTALLTIWTASGFISVMLSFVGYLEARKQRIKTEQWAHEVCRASIVPGMRWRIYRDQPGNFTTVLKVQGDRVTYQWVQGPVEDTKDNFLKAFPYPGVSP